MQIAIVGLPASGKSTVFAALSGHAPAGASRRGDLERAVVKVPDQRVDALSALFRPRKTTPAEVQYVAAPDLSRNGHGTEGWSTLLGQLRQVDAIVQVVRAFDDPANPHPAGRVDPLRDLDELQSELLLADMVVIERRLERLEKEGRSAKKGQSSPERDLLLKLKARLDAGLALRGVELDPDETKALRGYGFLSAKPVLFLFNTGPEGLDGQAAPLARRVAELGALSLSFDGKLERELVDLPPDEQQEMLAAFGLEEPALARAIRASYRLLDVISFFTVGEDEVRAWTVRRGTPAAEAAGVIHSDIARGFIRAEVVTADDLLRVGSLAEARKQGLLRAEGRNYEVKDGDVVNYLFNV